MSNPVVIASHNGLKATQCAYETLCSGADALDAVLKGVDLVEDDPGDNSVGYGGLPNSDGFLELEACCMHGPTHQFGAVAGLQDIRYPARVAKAVMQSTPHGLLVGENAKQFAIQHGWKTENLLSAEAENIYKYWQSYQDGKISELDIKNSKIPEKLWDYFGITGTLTCLGQDADGGLSGVTTTSGLAFKLPGRVGDSSIIGAGLYVDNEAGACGSIGKGEENLRNLNCLKVVQQMKKGKSPESACQLVIREHLESEQKYRPFDQQQGPGYNITLIAVSAAGETGAAAIYGPQNYAIHDGKSNRLESAAYIFERTKK